MKNILISLSIALIVCTFTCCTPETKTAETPPASELCKEATFQLFPTTNMWNFIKLNTRNGLMWQVQFDVQGDNQSTVTLNPTPLVSKEQEADGRFTLYPTKNMYNFILLDQKDGRTWQTQWSFESENRLIIPIK